MFKHGMVIVRDIWGLSHHLSFIVFVETLMLLLLLFFTARWVILLVQVLTFLFFLLNEVILRGRCVRLHLVLLRGRGGILMVLVILFQMMRFFMLVYLLGDIDQVRVKQDFRVLIANAMVIRQRVDGCHGLEVVVQVLGLSQSQVGLGHDLVSLADDLVMNQYVVHWFTLLALKKYLERPCVFRVTPLSFSTSFIAKQALARFQSLIDWENWRRRLWSMNVNKSIWYLFWIVVVEWSLHCFLGHIS